VIEHLAGALTTPILLRLLRPNQASARYGLGTARMEMTGQSVDLWKPLKSLPAQVSPDGLRYFGGTFLPPPLGPSRRGLAWPQGVGLNEQIFGVTNKSGDRV